MEIPETGQYCLQSKLSKLYLDVYDGNDRNGGRVCQSVRHGPGEDRSELWSFHEAGDGYYYVRSAVSGLDLDVKNGSRSNGAEVCQARPTEMQVWRLIPAGGDYYRLQSKVEWLVLGCLYG